MRFNLDLIVIFVYIIVEIFSQFKTLLTISYFKCCKIPNTKIIGI